MIRDRSPALILVVEDGGRYTPSGGTVWVGAAKEPESVLVSIANAGPGIPGSDLPHIFERFYRVEKSRAVETAEPVSIWPSSSSWWRRSAARSEPIRRPA